MVEVPGGGQTQVPQPKAFPGGASGKNPPDNAGDIRDASLSQEDPLKEGMATHSSILAWKISWTEEPGGLVHSVAKSWTLPK